MFYHEIVSELRKVYNEVCTLRATNSLYREVLEAIRHNIKTYEENCDIVDVETDYLSAGMIIDKAFERATYLENYYE